MTLSQIKEARRRLSNMYSWLISQVGTDNFEEKARAVERYAELLEKVENNYKYISQLSFD